MLISSHPRHATDRTASTVTDAPRRRTGGAVALLAAALLLALPASIGAQAKQTLVLTEGSVPPKSWVEVAEAGTSDETTATYTVRLNTKPTNDVIVYVTSSDTAAATVSSGSLTFTTADSGTGAWRTAQAITVTGVNDDVDNAGDSRLVTITHTPAGGGYTAAQAASIQVWVTDDTAADDTAHDVAELSVTENDGTTALNSLTIADEHGGTGVYKVHLATKPTSDVTVHVASKDTSIATVSPSSLKFSPTNYGEPQRVIVIAEPDSVDNPGGSRSVVITNTASGGGYDAVAEKINVTVQDAQRGNNDVAALVVTPTEVTTDTLGVSPTDELSITDEDGGTATYTVKLATDPTRTVTVHVVSSNPSIATVSPLLLTFTPANWFAVQKVTVTGVNDDEDNANDARLVVITNTPSGYSGAGSKYVHVSVKDDDAQGLKLSRDEVTVDEAGGTSQYKVKLKTKPPSATPVEVTVTGTAGAGLFTVAPTTPLTFNAINWDDWQTVTVTGVPDDIDNLDDKRRAIITNSCTTPADACDAVAVQVTVEDDDKAGMEVAPTKLTVADDGTTTDTYTVKLTSDPRADVTLSVKLSGDTSAGSVSTPVVFDTSNWRGGQIITVRGTADAVDNPGSSRSLTITNTLSEGGYDEVQSVDVKVSVTDTEDEGDSELILRGAPIVVIDKDNSRDHYTVRLKGKPVGGDVTVSATIGTTGIALLHTVDTSQETGFTAGANNVALSFTPEDYNRPQTIRVSGVSNKTYDGGDRLTSITHTVAPDGAVTVDDGDGDDTNNVAYSTNGKSISLRVRDDDTAGLKLSKSSLSTSEGEEETYTVVLTSQPDDGDVTVTVISSDPTAATVDTDATTANNQDTLTFSSTDWDMPQTVIVTGVNDDVDNARSRSVSITHTPSGGGYDDVDSKDVKVTVADRKGETAKLIIPEHTRRMDEGGGTSSYPVRLSTEPTGYVTVRVESSNQEVATVKPASLTFTPANWDNTQSVTVTGVRSGKATITHDPDGGGYSGARTASVAVEVLEDQSAGLRVPLQVVVAAEGETASYTVELKTQPVEATPVTVTLRTDESIATVAPSSLTFTHSNWDPKTVTVTGVSDDKVNAGGSRSTTITHTAAGGDYDGESASVQVSVTDDDATATLSPSRVTVTEARTATRTATYTLKLDGQPTGEVTVDVASSDTATATAIPSTLTFTAANWSRAQTVTVTGVDNQVDDGASRSATITHTFSGGGFDDVTNTVSVTVTDDDGLVVSRTAAEVAEAGGTASYTVKLSSPPAGTVTVAVASSNTDAATVSPPTLTFTTDNWSRPQPVTITGVPDNVDNTDNRRTVSITHAPSGYGANAEQKTVAVTVTDDDDAPEGITLSVDPPRVGESAGATPIKITATVNGTTRYADAKTITVAVGATGDRADEGTDYQTVGAVWVRIDAGAASGAATFTLTPMDDTDSEGDEGITVSGTSAGIAVTPNEITLVDDDAPLEVSISATPVDEDATPALLLFMATLSRSTSREVTVDYAVTGGTATSDADYEALSAGTLTFAPGETLMTLTVTVMDDQVYEGDETVEIALSNPSIYTTLASGVSMAVGTIEDDEDPPELSIQDSSVIEDDTEDLLFLVSKSGVTERMAIVAYEDAGTGTATAGDDYAAVTRGTLTFAADENHLTIRVTVHRDDTYEDHETVVLRLSDPTHAEIAVGEASGTIVNDDAEPELSIRGETVTEGAAGATTPLVFTVTKAGATSKVVTVDYADAGGGTAEAGADYEAFSGGTLTFMPGETLMSLTVTVMDDAIDEDDETVEIALSNPSLDTDLGESIAAGTIVDDDAPAVLSIRGGEVTEGAAGDETTPLVFTVTKAGATSKVVTVDYQVGGTAEAGADYEALADGTLTFAPGEIEMTLTVAVMGDDMDEDDETVEVTLNNPVNATLAPGEGMAVGTIVDDDAPAVLSISGETVTEGAAGATTPLVFTVTKAGATSKVVTVDYQVGGTAEAGADYEALADGTLTFAPDETSKDLTITVMGDDMDEDDETVVIALSSPVNATLAPDMSTAVGTIVDDDAPPVLSISGETVTEGAAGATTPLVFTVTKAGATSKVVTVDYQVGGTAEAGADYEALADGTLTFAPGEIEKTLTVAVMDDDVDEDDETVEVTLNNPVNATLAPDESMAAGTIVDDDAPSVLSISGKTVAEGAAGTTTPLVFTVAKAGATSKVVTVGYAVTGGTARSGEDYQAFRGGRLTFEPAATEQRLTVMVNGDDKPEADETVEISLRGPVNATLAEGRSKATGTITDDDVLVTVARDWMARFGRTAAAATVDAIARRMNDGADVDEQSLTLGGERVSLAGTTPQPLARQAPAAVRIEPWEDATAQSISLQDLAEEAAFDIGRSLEDGYLSVWGASSYHQFESAPKDQYKLDGNLVSAILGADHAGDNHVAGLALAYHAGGGEYGDIYGRGDFAGQLEASLFSFHPYVRLTIGAFHIGGSFGVGTGSMNISPDGGTDVETGLTMTALGAIDARYDLSLAPEWLLAVQADAQTVHMVSAEKDPELPALETATNRVRLGLETSYAFLVGEGMSLAPTLEAGMRHDGGDAETGFGLDAGGGVRFIVAAAGLMVDARGRAAWKNMNEEQSQAPALRDWGIGGVIRWRPDFGGHGPEVTVAPTYDGQALNAGPSLGAAVGYRLPVFGGILTPYRSVELAGSGQRSYSLGARFEVDRVVEVGAEGTYQQSTAGEAEEFFTLRVRLQQ